MFSYFGSKSKIVHLYPPAEYERVIEPFAGSAQYALQHYGRQVILIERSPVIACIWRWLIQEATVKDIESLPELGVGDTLDNYKQLIRPEKLLLGFAVATAQVRPCKFVSKMGACNLANLKSKWLYYVPRIKHWKILQRSYLNYRQNEEATWFIDPPYSIAGEQYPYCEINYRVLAEWCKTRTGQVIVCEGAGAKWLPFQRLTIQKTQLSTLHGKSGEELIWTNDSK